MPKPKGNKKSQAAGTTSRRPRQKGKVKNRPQPDYLSQVAQMSKEIGQAERAEYDKLKAQGCKESVAKNLAARAGFKKRNELLAQR